MAGLPAWWLRNGWRARALLPLAGLFRLLSGLRRGLYRTGIKRSYAAGVPVLVVGNIFIGGTGKTPLVVWLAQRLSEKGHRVGIVTRGYGGRARHWPQAVAANSDPTEVGDEAVLLARRANCPVMAGPDRVAAARALAQSCDVLLSDDGLQHYRLRRDREIVVFDGRRGAGNGHCLPAGPLREPLSRARRADLVLVNGEASREWPLAFGLEPRAWVNLTTGERRPPQAFHGQRAQAIAGIGNPARFFDQLSALGVEADCTAFADHHGYRLEDLPAADLPLLMTEKDAVKCAGFAAPHMWYLAVEAVPSTAAEAALDALLQDLLRHV